MFGSRKKTNGSIRGKDSRVTSEDLQKLLLAVVTAFLAGLTGLLIRPKSNVAEAVSADIQKHLNRRKTDKRDTDEMKLALQTAAGATKLLDRMTDDRFGEIDVFKRYIVSNDFRMSQLEANVKTILEQLNQKTS